LKQSVKKTDLGVKTNADGVILLSVRPNTFGVQR